MLLCHRGNSIISMIFIIGAFSWVQWTYRDFKTIGRFQYQLRQFPNLFCQVIWVTKTFHTVVDSPQILNSMINHPLGAIIPIPFIFGKTLNTTPVVSYFFTLVPYGLKCINLVICGFIFLLLSISLIFFVKWVTKLKIKGY